MPRRNILEQILRLDPEKDDERIVFLSACYEFPFDITRSLEFALFRTFAAPSISALLERTGEMARRSQKRYDDTDLLLSEIYEHGHSSERGRAAIRRMNRLHGRYEIANDDFLYVLSTFTYEPIRWNARFGWRPLVEQEKLAYFYFWRTIGRMMNIKNIPADFATFERFNVDYERERFRYAESNRRVAIPTRDMFLGWFLPAALQPLGAPALYAIMDEPLLNALGFPHPPPALRRLVEGSLRLRGWLAAQLPDRRRPRIRTTIRRPAYPRGYRIEELGPPP